MFEFHGYLDMEQAKQMYLAVMKMMEGRPVVSFLNDLRELKGTFTGLTNWILKNMMPVLQLGLRYDALVLNHDVFTIFAANDFASKISTLELQLFKSMDEAENWLSSKEG
ncbi:MAG: STAS/SEC14 domain-containing protein [Cyclobacteriaceae bacterium]|nr:STAS/SEC14 domain-containing protein [Cyclobacteriaceae bacterium]